MTQLRNTRHGVAFKRPLIAALLTIGMIVPSVGLVQTAGAVESAAPAAVQTSAAAAQEGSSKSGAQRTQEDAKKPAAQAAATNKTATIAPQKAAASQKTQQPSAPAAKTSKAPVQPAPATTATTAAKPAQSAPSKTPAPAAAADEEQTVYYHFYTDPDSEASDNSIACTMGKTIAQCPGFPYLTISKPGYTFAGWYASKDLSGSPIDPNTTIVDKGWAAFYAKWAKNETAPAVDKYDLAEQDGTVVVVAPAAGNATIETNLNEFLGGYVFGEPVQSDGQWTIQATLGSNQLSNGWTMVMSKFLWLEPPVNATDFDKSWSGTNYTATFTYDEAAKAWKLTTPVKLAVKTEAPKPKTFTLTFETNGGSAIAPQQVQEGGTYSPDEPTRDGYTFAGWFVDKELTKPVDLVNFKIEQDTTVYAKWTKNETKPQQPGGQTPTKPETKPTTKPSTKPATKKPAAKKGTAKKTTAKKSTKKLSKTGSSIASIAFVAMALAGAGIMLGRKRAE